MTNLTTRVHLDYHSMLPTMAELTKHNGPDKAYIFEIHADGQPMGFLAGHGQITNKWWNSPWKNEFLSTFSRDNTGHTRSKPLYNPFTKNSAMFLSREDCTSTLLAALDMGVISPDIFIAKIGLALVSYETGVISKVRFYEIQNDLASQML